MSSSSVTEFEALKGMADELVQFYELDKPPYNGVEYAIRLASTTSFRVLIGDRTGATYQGLTAIAIMAAYVDSFDELVEFMKTHMPQVGKQIIRQDKDETISATSVLVRNLMFPDNIDKWQMKSRKSGRIISMIPDESKAFENAMIDGLLTMQAANTWFSDMLMYAVGPTISNLLNEKIEGKCATCKEDECPVFIIRDNPLPEVRIKRLIESIRAAILLFGPVGVAMIDDMDFADPLGRISPLMDMIRHFMCLVQAYPLIASPELAEQIHNVLLEDEVMVALCDIFATISAHYSTDEGRKEFEDAIDAEKKVRSKRSGSKESNLKISVNALAGGNDEITTAIQELLNAMASEGELNDDMSAEEISQVIGKALDGIGLRGDSETVVVNPKDGEETTTRKILNAITSLIRRNTPHKPDQKGSDSDE